MKKPWEEEWYVDVQQWQQGIRSTYCNGIRIKNSAPNQELSDIDEAVVETDSGYYPPKLETGQAHLIAAAPDLYRALAECMEIFENVVDMEAGNPRGSRHVAECIRKAEAAMRKARGE